MGRLLASVCWLLCLAPAILAATRPVAEPAAASSAADSPLKKLGWLVGGTWVAEEKAADGDVVVVRLRCRWADTGNAIFFRVAFVSDGAETPQYDGMFVWHPGRNKLTLWQVNRKGEVAEGEVTGSGDEFDQVVRVSHPDGSVHFLKGTIGGRSATSSASGRSSSPRRRPPGGTRSTSSTGGSPSANAE